MNAARSTAYWITPRGRSAVATIAVVGPNAANDLQSHFHSASGRSLASLPLDAIAYGRWGGSAGEELVICRRPDAFEIHCHGGLAAANAILDQLSDTVDIGQPEDWLRTQVVDEIEREVQLALAEAATTQTAARLLAQGNGALRQRLDQLQQKMDVEPERGRAEAESLLAQSRFGLHLTTPWRVTLSGPPNVGKSSLINRIVGYDRAVVYDQPGTTRDTVIARSPLRGWPIAWTDTAGVREASDPLEQEGVRRAAAARAEADLVLEVQDARDAKAAPQTVDAILVLNKADLVAETPPGTLAVSALTGAGVEQLLEAVAARLFDAAPAALDEPLLFTQRQVELVRSWL